MITRDERSAVLAAGLEAAQGELLQCASWGDVWRYASSLTNETPTVSPAAYEHLQQGDLPDVNDPLRSIADRAVGITQAELAIAETGSVLLIEPSPRDRAVSLLTKHLIVAVSEGDIIEELADGFRWLARQPRAASYATFVTGPSRTADIERSLTIGVQGPSRLTVAVLA
ncbi:MAG: LUD domain-containing protein [Chloroflexota bacterium]|nr:LUD domain-containing protein [Chloroflexota bacterium]